MHQLDIRGLRLLLRVGAGDQERREPQPILVDFRLLFAAEPVACRTDRLDDTVCYERLCGELCRELERREFHLLEYLAAEIGRLLLQRVDASVEVTVHKRPPIPQLTGGASFTWSS